MLVLTRKHQEKIQIGENVTITILKVKGRTVRLGIEAPKQVRVVRGELPRLPGEDVGSSTVTAGEQPAGKCLAAAGARSKRPIRMMAPMRPSSPTRGEGAFRAVPWRLWSKT